MIVCPASHVDPRGCLACYPEGAGARAYRRLQYLVRERVAVVIRHDEVQYVPPWFSKRSRKRRHSSSCSRNGLRSRYEDHCR